MYKIYITDYTHSVRYNYLMAMRTTASLFFPETSLSYFPTQSIVMYIYNIRTLSENIKFICTSFRNR